MFVFLKLSIDLVLTISSTNINFQKTYSCSQFHRDLLFMKLNILTNHDKKKISMNCNGAIHFLFYSFVKSKHKNKTKIIAFIKYISNTL